MILVILGTLFSLAVAEYLGHRLVMHHDTPLDRGAYHRHTTLHHRAGRVDVNIDAEAWFYLLVWSPVLSALAWCGHWTQALVSAGLVASYAWLWTGLHRSIHGLGGRWTQRLPFYGALERHHLTHHRRPGRNFGAVFGPLLDWPLGTWAPWTDPTPTNGLPPQPS